MGRQLVKVENQTQWVEVSESGQRKEEAVGGWCVCVQGEKQRVYGGSFVSVHGQCVQRGGARQCAVVEGKGEPC